jgi:hypothetical protein
MKDNIKTVARVNNVAMQLVEEAGQKYIPVRPVCEALGIDFEGQRQRLERDEILKTTTFIIKAVAADGKEREMFCLPFKFVFGWLFTIETSKVNEDARPAVIKYQLECYNALFDYFVSRAEFVEQKQKAIDCQLDIVDTAKTNFNQAKNVLSDAEKRLKALRTLTIEDFDMEKRQLKISFETEKL